LPLDERDNRHAVRNKVDRIVMILIVDKQALGTLQSPKENYKS